jgi:hypothetical protein
LSGWNVGIKVEAFEKIAQALEEVKECIIA